MTLHREEARDRVLEPGQGREGQAQAAPSA